MTTDSHYALRLQTWIIVELRTVVEAEETMINQFINVAVSEKIAALRTEQYFQERAARANRSDFIEILARAGSERPRECDEFP